MKKFVLASVACIALATSASAQSANTSTLAESMRQSIAQCTEGTYADVESTSVYINKQCARTQFSALQTYIDAASLCIKNPQNSEICNAAKILEAGLIKTFSSKQMVKK